MLFRIFFFVVISLISALSFAEIADKILVNKSEGKLYLYKNNKIFSSYSVVFGSNKIGHKEKEGDGRTPEGNYIIDNKNENSSYYKSLHISYPNATDIAKAKLKGISPGGEIMIHGQKNGFGWAAFITQHFNWTKGCIALSNTDMQQVWQSVNIGTSIEIKP